MRMGMEMEMGVGIFCFGYESYDGGAGVRGWMTPAGVDRGGAAMESRGL